MNALGKTLGYGAVSYRDSAPCVIVSIVTKAAETREALIGRLNGE